MSASPRAALTATLLSFAAAAGCGGQDTTQLTPLEAAVEEMLAPGELVPPPAIDSPVDEVEAWRPGLDVRPRAAAFAATFPPRLELAPAGWSALEAFPALSFDDPVFLAEAPGSGRLLVAEREGRMYAFENDPGVQRKRLVLDLSARTQGESDSGLLGFVFHPEFGQREGAHRTHVFLHYAFRPNPIVGQVPGQNTPTVSRLSRFEVDLDTLDIDPDSELVLIDQKDDNLYHQGGALFFHPRDGFLYLAVGDEGASRGRLGNCQRIDKDLFSGVLRIDVDERGGDVSHPIVRQPATGTTANYFIPSDNPFVGQPGVLEEFYALGLRSPHRMTHDPTDDITWIGEVGQSSREELDVLRPAANFQWNVLEGSLPGVEDMPEAPLGVWTDPVLELPRTEAASIIGGYVYRGTRLPELYGKYIFADFVTGNLWALAYDHDGARTTVLERELLLQTPFRNRQNGITSFGVDLKNELYLLTLGSRGKIYRLDRSAAHANAPRRLSETGLFADTASPVLAPSASLVPYDVQNPLWSDGAQKERWVSIPDGASAGFAEARAWTFPEGTLFVKHFELALDETAPAERRRLETRVLVHAEGGGYYGVTYRWNGEQTDAELLLESHTESIDVRLANGTSRHLDYFYPAPADCGVCHTPEAGSVLGVRTAQLNHTFSYPAREANQIYTWGQLGLLDVPLDPLAVSLLPSLVSPSDTEASDEARVRSYWASNCSMCHGSIPDMRTRWDARYEVPLAEQGVIYGASESAMAEGVFLVAPGDPEASLLFQRSASVDPEIRMPPLGRSAADGEYVELLRRWIEGL